MNLEIDDRGGQQEISLATAVYNFVVILLSSRCAASSASKRRLSIRLVCRDICPETRKGPSEGMITAALCHPLEQMSTPLVETMIETITQGASGGTIQRTITF
nr:hypothetical protein [Rhizobium leguminosarum]